MPNHSHSHPTSIIQVCRILRERPHPASWRRCCRTESPPSLGLPQSWRAARPALPAQEKQPFSSTLVRTRRRELDDRTGIGNRGAPTQSPPASNACHHTKSVRHTDSQHITHARAAKRRSTPATASRRSCHDGGGGRHAGRPPPWPHAAADPAGLGLQPWLLLARVAAGAAAGVSLLSRRRLRPACVQEDPGSAPSPANTAMLYDVLMRKLTSRLSQPNTCSWQLLQPSALSTGCRSSRIVLVPVLALLPVWPLPDA